MVKKGKNKNQGGNSQPGEEEFIGHYKEAPGYMKDNEAITHGYRINFNTPKKIFKTMFTLHNESVNIWTHFVPALILIVSLTYLLMCVGPTSIYEEFQAGKKVLNEGINSYSQALNEIGVVIKMKEITEYTEKEIVEITQSAIDKYTHFSDSANEWKQNIGGKFSLIQHSMKNKFSLQVKELEELKEDFQKLFVPYIFSQIKGKIDNYDPEYIMKLESKLKSLKQKLDSDTFKYIQFPYHDRPNPHKVSRWPLFVFMSSAVICLLCSTIFHLFYPMSARIYTLFSRLDYAGVNILISGSAVPFIYYSMYCNFQLAIFYLVFIFTLGGSLFVFTLFDFLHRPENFRLKSMAYGGFGVSLAIPLTHCMINQHIYSNYGDSFTMTNTFIKYLLVGASYLFGLYVYTVRCPQRRYPGKFNVCGHSHQIWHCFVVLGIIFTYLAALQNFETRKLAVCPAVPFIV